MKKGLFAKVSRSFVACALTAAVAALSFPLSAFALYGGKRYGRAGLGKHACLFGQRAG